MGKSVSCYTEYTPEDLEFEKVIVDALMNFEESIDVTKFVKEYGWSINELKSFSSVSWSNPELFFVDTNSYRCSILKSEDGEILECKISDYKFEITKEEYSKCKVELDQAVAEAMKTVKGVSDPVEKVKRLHDYLIRVCEYDEQIADEDKALTAVSMYSVLVRHKAICQGYARAYHYLLCEAGIESEILISYDMNHCWNYVKIGKNWYHVDVTYDDPVFDGKDPATSHISYCCFLLSDKAMRGIGHRWSVEGLPAACDQTYDFWDWGWPYNSKFDNEHWQKYILKYIRKKNKIKNS